MDYDFGVMNSRALGRFCKAGALCEMI